MTVNTNIAKTLHGRSPNLCHLLVEQSAGIDESSYVVCLNIFKAFDTFWNTVLIIVLVPFCAFADFHSTRVFRETSNLLRNKEADILSNSTRRKHSFADHPTKYPILIPLLWMETPFKISTYLRLVLSSLKLNWLKRINCR